TALDQASASGMEAKPRLALETEVAGIGAELNAVRRLMDLLARAGERFETELDIEEVVYESFSASVSMEPIRSKAITVFTSFSRDGLGFRASAPVVVPLIGLGIGIVQKGPGDRVAVEGRCRDGEPVVFTISREAKSGESHRFDPPLAIPPTVLCAETAAQLA